MAAVTALMPAPLTTSSAQSGQAWVDSPTSSERWRIHALIGSPVTTSSNEIPAPTAAPPSSGRASTRSKQAARRTPDQHTERADSDAEPGEPENPLHAAKILGPFELKCREVLF